MFILPFLSPPYWLLNLWEFDQEMLAEACICYGACTLTTSSPQKNGAAGVTEMGASFYDPFFFGFRGAAGVRAAASSKGT